MNQNDNPLVLESTAKFIPALIWTCCFQSRTGTGLNLKIAVSDGNDKYVVFQFSATLDTVIQFRRNSKKIKR